MRRSKPFEAHGSPLQRLLADDVGGMEVGASWEVKVYELGLYACLLLPCFAWDMFPLSTAQFCDARAVAVYLQMKVRLSMLLGILPMKYTMCC